MQLLSIYIVLADFYTNFRRPRFDHVVYFSTAVLGKPPNTNVYFRWKP